MSSRSLGRTVGEGLAACAALGLAVLLLVEPASLRATTKVANAAPVLPTVAAPSAEGLTNRCVNGRVALTFDDGPGPYTPAVLSILRRYQAKATFFVLGEKVAARPDLLRAVVADGHVVANHTWNHPHLVDLDAAAVREQLATTAQAIRAAGVQPITLMRPPFGSTDPAVAKVATSMGLRVSLWTYDSEDWRGRAPADMAAGLFRELLPNTVVLLHDGTADPSNTIAALPAMIEGLRHRGYCTVAMT